jgi:DNA repair protein RadC
MRKIQNAEGSRMEQGNLFENAEGGVKLPGAKIRYSAVYRIEARRVKEPEFRYSGVELTQPLRVVEFSRAGLEDSDIEKMVILYLNSKNKLIAIKTFFGTIDRANIYPREILKDAILSNAATAIIVHNHPSGDPSPSPEDKNLTRTLQETFKVIDMRLLDSIILGSDGRYYSFMEHREIVQ